MPAAEIRFVVSGRLEDSGATGTRVRLAAQRGGGSPVRLSARPGRDVVLLHLAGGPTLTLHPENALDLLRAQAGTERGAVAADDEIEVGPQLRWRGLEQAAPTRGAGFLGDVLLSGFEILTGTGGTSTAAQFVAGKTVQLVDRQVDAGVYALDAAALQPLKGSGRKQTSIAAAHAGAPLLVLVHGTFVDTASTFGKLWAQHPSTVRDLFSAYGGRVYALDHPTLGASPIANALTLVQALPRGARLHLLTHSRGGLVAEVLARVASQRTISRADLAPFAGDAYATERADLQALAKAVVERDVAVDRIVRIACPAHGTLLASKRLDAYVSVLKWGLEIAGVPVLPTLVDFATEVARSRADPALLPGLESMLQGSPLINWLNAAPAPIAGDLRVIAGDLQGDSVASWLKTLLADAYYWTDNDIVVQTRSMYGGAARDGGASFLLDQGGKVNHFSYFSNDRTADAIAAALTKDAPAGFRTIGPLSWSGQDSSGQRGIARGATDARAGADKPAVFLLPGILGSNLKAGDSRIWLAARILGGLNLIRWAADNPNVAPDGPVSMVYGDLAQYLAASHEVVSFGYDWRAPVEAEARRLGAAVDAALDARKDSGQPVRILAHSMGGLLARTMQLECPQTWQRLMAHDQARLLMLGTPNGGSWAPMQVLSGDDTFGNALVGFGSPFQDHAARQLMAAMPGFLQLQCGVDNESVLGSSAVWKKLADDDLAAMQQRNWWHRSAGEATETAYQWGVPPQDVLDQARALRKRLDQQRDQVLPAFAAKMLLVIGHAKFTPDGYEAGAEGVVYLDATDGGDGRVALESALLPGVLTWSLDCAHGDLPSTTSAFDAYVELLQTGTTQRLARWQPAATRGAAPSIVHVRSRPSRGRLLATPADSERAVFDSPRAALVESPDAPSGAALRVGVLNGNLTFVSQPLLIGHYRSHLLTGTEKAVNELVGGAMATSLAGGRYPQDTGTAQVFIHRRRDSLNPWLEAQAQNVIVVGLGDEGQLRERELSASARAGAIEWAERVAQGADNATAHFELAATLMGSGGIGVHASTSARAIAQGVRDANDFLAGNGWPVVSRLVLIELYLERASDAWHGLQVLATSNPGRIEVEAAIASGNGALRRPPDGGYRGADYDFVTATTAGEGTIEFTLDSKRARTELRAQATQAKLVRELVQRGSTADSQDPQIGRTLFQLLVPPEIEPFLSGTDQMMLELDDGTAPIPWELLDTPPDRRGGSDTRPWAVRSRLLRKLRCATYRDAVQDAASEDNVLVVGEPLVDDPRYPRLPGALAEAKAVARTLGSAGGVTAEQLTTLVDRPDAPTIVGALLGRRYRIVHIAGHGEAGPAGGVVMSGGTFLGPREVKTIRTVPELVFINCCHGAARDAGTVLHQPDRAGFAYGIADALIGIGVRCVIAAGWAVDDAPASLFATTFYRALLDGETFIGAVALAREAAWQQGGNTWAAYQCYGDPQWVFRSSDGGAASARSGDEFAAIASPLGLALILEELAVQSRWQRDIAPASQRAKIGQLEARFADTWGSMGAIAEAFGAALAECGARDDAIAWYRRAQLSNDGSASMKVNEQLANLIARHAWSTVQNEKPDSPRFDAARREMQAAIALLETLITLAPTMERSDLAGSAYKRLAMLERRCGRRADAAAALNHAVAAYRGAELQATALGHPQLFYAALNRMACELVAAMDAGTWGGFDAAATAAARASVVSKMAADPDFWSAVAQSDIDLCVAVAEARLAASWPALNAGYGRVHERVASAPLWMSVADGADFVLTPYLGGPDAAERAAAAQVLALLRGFAGIKA